MRSVDGEKQGEVEPKNVEQCWNQTKQTLLISLIALKMSKKFIIQRVKCFDTMLPAKIAKNHALATQKG